MVVEVLVNVVLLEVPFLLDQFHRPLNVQDDPFLVQYVLLQNQHRQSDIDVSICILVGRG